MTFFDFVDKYSWGCFFTMIFAFEGLAQVFKALRGRE